MHAILVPGGFGERGSEGKIASVRFARERRVPFFGICLGMQMACIEGARAAGHETASSTEFGPTEAPVVGIITEWMSKEGLQQRSSEGDLGGTMRLGAYEAKLAGNSHVSQIYGGATEIFERHRHRYEVNSAYRDLLEKQGLIFSGMSPDGLLPEIVERPDHPWFVGVQFHPELKSKPFDPHPLFSGFIAAALAQSRLV
jgi:CTP synthase